MTISPYFRNLRSAYFAELDDLTFDSEGVHILDKRLVQRRKEMEFLVHMMEISPEMVSVVFHKGFRFKSLAVMDDLLSHEPDALPEWDTLAGSIELAPWTKPLLAIVQKQPMGDWFLTVATALEYMYSKPEHAHASGSNEADEHEEDADGDHKDKDHVEADAHGGKRGAAHADDDHADDSDERGLDEAGADWMAEQGFDRKD